MDSTILIIIAIVLVVLVGAVLLMRRLSWGRSPGYIQLPRAAPPSAMPSLGPDGDRDVRVLLASGQKIQAIKLVRELTGIGLKEAKDYVESLPSIPLNEARLAASDTHVDNSGAHLADLSADPELRALLAAGNKIAAIKRVRELTGMGLKAAKDFVDSL
jgi:ribosomal protein L7/L12